MRRVLKELGYNNLHVVKKQEKPDGNFPTTSSPNPENREVFNLALELAKEIQPDIIFGTDPDCDRIGVVVKDESSEYRVLTGNQIGVLLTHYMLSSLKEENNLPKNAAIIKTIVTTDLAKKISSDFNVELIEVLTGFKYIGEKIKEFEETKSNTFILGFEESYGYLAGTFVRDKDAVIAASLISEMALWHKLKGKSLYDALIDLYIKYGYYKEELVSITLEGKEGMETIDKIMTTLRSTNVFEDSTVKLLDYSNSIDNLPKSNVLKFKLNNDDWLVIRPSGTEPKIKIYYSVKGCNMQEVENKYNKLKSDVDCIIKKIM